MRILFVPHSRTVIPYHLLSGLSEIGVDVFWCGKKEWWPPHQQPIPRYLLERQRPPSIFQELTGDDVIVLPDRLSLCPMKIPTNTARLIIIDTLDGPNISLGELSIAHLYFKCQLPSKPENWYLSSQEEKAIKVSHIESPLKEYFQTHQGKIRPFPYSTITLETRSPINPPGRDIFFLGWDSGGASHRREVVQTMKESFGGRFSGGLFERGDLLQRVVPSELLHPKITPLNLYKATSKDFKINLAPRSNGQLSFRLYELLSWGCFVMAERLDYPILPEEPRDREHLVYFKSDLTDLVELCNYYLDNEEERQRIAKQGYDFYWEKLSPRSIAKYFLEQLEVV